MPKYCDQSTLFFLTWNFDCSVVVAFSFWFFGDNVVTFGGVSDELSWLRSWSCSCFGSWICSWLWSWSDFSSVWLCGSTDCVPNKAPRSWATWRWTRFLNKKILLYVFYLQLYVIIKYFMWRDNYLCNCLVIGTLGSVFNLFWVDLGLRLATG